MDFYASRYDSHEREIGEVALEMGFDQVSLSSAVMPMVKVVPRGYTGTWNWYHSFIFKSGGNQAKTILLVLGHAAK